MIRNDERQAFLIITPELSKHVLKLYKRLTEATARLGDVFLLFHSQNGQLPDPALKINVEVFTNGILTDMGYKPIKPRLVPGSNHFPVLDFSLRHPGYKYYWCIEDDVVFRGRWSDFFSMVSPEKKYDFISSHIRRRQDIPNWWWWDSLTVPGNGIEKSRFLSSFNPAYRISREALAYIDTCLKNGYSGHHEVLLPTLLREGGFSLADFSNTENHVTPNLSLCTLRTMRWKPVFVVPGNRRNMLYHPVKPKLTMDQLYVYVKRTLMNKKEYLT